jgi:hypothetical protein
MHRRNSPRGPGRIARTRPRRPRKWRHWPRPPIGSDEWWELVRRLGVSRREVEAALDRGEDASRASIDPHDVRPPDSLAARAVTYFALYPDVPTYATLMYVVHTWSQAGRSLKEWIVAQFATILDGDEARLHEAALYSLWVDYFEVPTRAAFCFPRLLRMCTRVEGLLSSSGPVPWAVKRSHYLAAAAVPSLHPALALGIASSFYDILGSVEPVEARALARQIDIADSKIRAALDEAFAPTRWRIVGVAAVDESDERWRRWLHASSDAPSFLVAMRAHGRSYPWVYGSEVRLGATLIGRLVHHSFPFDRAIRHQCTGELDGTLFRIEGDRALARDAIGCDVDVWPAGLFETTG